MNNRKRFNQILEDIKNVKIQGARTIAKKALEAYSLFPTKKSKSLLISARPTEPMLERAISESEKSNYSKVFSHFDLAQEKINKNLFKLIKNKDVIFTHCHSTNVVNALIYAKKHGKKFEVYNTETRPLFQGRKTSIELSKAGIKVTEFVDSGARIALTKSQGTKKADKVFIGADALTKKGIINKVGSGMFSEIAFNNKIPVYIVADSWKYTSKKIHLENRNISEIWKHYFRGISVRNPAFEFVPEKYIQAIVSEIGVLKYKDFVKRITSKKNSL